MDANQILNLISKQWCNLDDLILLTGLGKTKAMELKKNIELKLNKEGYLLPKRFLPMNEVVKYLKIDINYLQSLRNDYTFRKDEYEKIK